MREKGERRRRRLEVDDLLVDWLDAREDGLVFLLFVEFRGREAESRPLGGRVEELRELRLLELSP